MKAVRTIAMIAALLLGLAAAVAGGIAVLFPGQLFGDIGRLSGFGLLALGIAFLIAIGWGSMKFTIGKGGVSIETRTLHAGDMQGFDDIEEERGRRR